MLDTRTVDTPPWDKEAGRLKSWERSLLRGATPNASRAVANQRPAGPSAASGTGMAVPAAPFSPGTRSTNPNASPTHPQVAASFRHNFSMPPDNDPLANRHPVMNANGR